LFIPRPPSSTLFPYTTLFRSNPAKYAFSKSYSGVAVSYTPYMSSITDDVFLLNASFYTFLGQEERSTLSASLYYFNIGEIDLTEDRKSTRLNSSHVKISYAVF